MPRLLLIEDEIGAIAALKRALARVGFEVLVATNLPDALSATENERPDAVLVSAGLGGEPASALVESLRAIDLVRPVVVLGDGAGTGEPSVPKPVDAARLVELLAELVPGVVVKDEEHVAGEHTNGAGPSAVQAPADNDDGVTAASLELARRRELAAKALAEAQARRRAAEAARAVPRPESVPTASPLPPQNNHTANHSPAAQPPAHLSAAKPKPKPLEAEPAPVPRPAPRRSLGVELFGDVPLEPSLPEGFELPRPPAAAPPPAPVADAAPPPQRFPDPRQERVEPQPEARVAPKPEAPVAKPKPEAPPKLPDNLELASPEGQLAKTEPAAVLLACHRSHLSGRVRFTQGPVQRTVFFADGRISGAASTSPEERLEALSYRRGLITRDQQRLLRAETSVPTRRLALLMVERGYLKPAELFALVQEQVEEIIYEACGGFAGQYQVLPEPVPDDERVALSRSPLALVTEGIRRKYLMDRLLAGLGGPATLLRPPQARGPDFSEFGLTARERRLAQSVDGLRNIEELLFESGNDPLPGLKTLYALWLGRAAEVAVRGLQAEPTPETQARIDLGRVSEKYEQVRSATYFEVLGVGPQATAYEIEQSYERLAREFQPVRFADLHRPELPGQLEEIQRILAEARDILVDEGLRSEYRAHLRK